MRISERSGQVQAQESQTLREHAVATGGWKVAVAPTLLAALYLAAHLLTLAPSLEDIDSINFALGLRDFDPGQHQPHPPGYPIYIAAGKGLLALTEMGWPAPDRAATEARALSLLSLFAGSLAIVFAWRVFALLAGQGDDGAPGRIRLWATVVLAVCPLFWITGVRPMSDMPGLAAAFAAQALLIAGRARAGAFVAGLALGVRSQTFWLTAPLVALELARSRGGHPWSDRAVVVLAAAGGALCWAVPLVAATGGLDAYLTALGTQAGEDFAFVDMLWASPTPRRLAWGLVHTFAMPWGSYYLAGGVLALASAGALVMVVRERRVLGVLLLAFAPYAAFHLVFQETVTVRYALPLVAPVGFLAARALALLGRATNMVATPMAVLLAMSGLAGAMAYAADPHPAFRAIADATRRATADRPALVTSHFELRRSLRAANPARLPVTYAPHRREWLELVTYWAGGGEGLVWFLANPRRTDLDLIDPYARRDVVRYRWRAEGRPELSGTRPSAADWYRLRPPAWFLGEGWSLTPETGGLTQTAGTGPNRQPIVGYIRRDSSPMHMVIGGRHLGAPADPAAAFELAIDGVAVDRWSVSSSDSAFLRFIDLPGGAAPAADGRYARLTVHAPQAPPAAVRQFDVQPLSRPVFGFDAGWHDEELDPANGMRWRWTSDRAVVRVRAPGRGIRLRIRGESPRRYFDTSPDVTLLAGDREIHRFRPSADWTLDVQVPADVLASAGGSLVLATSHVFTPAEIRRSPDTRRLGLRVFAVNVEASR